MEVLCTHCGRPRPSPRRSALGWGLCFVCYMTPSVVIQYRQRNGATRAEQQDFYGPAPLPPVPTTAPPGSEEKLHVLASRAAAGQALFHPEDEIPED